MKITEQLENVIRNKARSNKCDNQDCFVIGYLLQLIELEILKNPNLKAYVEWILENEK